MLLAVVGIQKGKSLGGREILHVLIVGFDNTAVGFDDSDITDLQLLIGGVVTKVQLTPIL